MKQNLLKLIGTFSLFAAAQAGIGQTLTQLEYYPESFSFPSRLTPFKNQVLFTDYYIPGGQVAKGYQPYITDGTVEGTTWLKNVDLDSTFGAYPIEFVAGADKAFFVAHFDRGLTNEPGQIYATDGTKAGTVKLTGITTDDSFGTTFFPFKDGAVFPAFTAETGYELWYSDGTVPGTHLVKDVNPGAEGSMNPIPDFRYTFAEKDGFVYFAANDGVNGTEVWKTDGTEAGTTLVRNVLGGTPDTSFNESFPRDFTRVGDQIYFVINTEPLVGRYELWKTDGTNGQTRPVISYNAFVNRTITRLVEYKGSLFFFARIDENSYGLYKTDGTEETTVLVKQFATEPNYQDIISYLKYKDLLLFQYYSESTQLGIWRTDGTTDGTFELEPADDENLIVEFNAGWAIVNNEVYFGGVDNNLGSDLWKTDGTIAGTEFVTDIPNEDGSNGRMGQIVPLGADKLLIMVGGISGTTELFVFEPQVITTTAKPENPQINVFPNPTSDFVLIKSQDALSVNVYNANGVLVKSETLNETDNQIEFAGKGLYFLEIITKSGIAKEKIVVY